MKIEKALGILFLTLFFAVSCTNNKKFVIKKGKVGFINTETKVSDLDRLFKNDSIVKNLSEGALGDDYFQDNDEYLIYEKGGKHLLTIIPKEQLDSTSTIAHIEIFDNRFVTEKGLNISSTFLEVKEKATINKIESTFSSATLFVDALNATIVIDNDELGLKDFNSQKINQDQIPDLAKMKSFIIWFN